VLVRGEPVVKLRLWLIALDLAVWLTGYGSPLSFWVLRRASKQVGYEDIEPDSEREPF
jgi:hypothetical protein